MRNYTLSLISALILSGLPFALSAQTDSTRIDIGSLSLNKAFTPHVTIRGEDLEKMPFVNLSEAISAWLFGAYTEQAMLAYVVDGNPVTDVNLYSIYDVEDVTLVEQAAGAAAYGGTQKTLVVIRTRRGKEKAGIRMAGQAGLVTRNGNGLKTFTNFYHHYYFGAYRSSDKVSYGVSADWTRDVMPASKGAIGHTVHVSTPYNLQRWRLYGYLVWRPSKGNVIDLEVGFAPQSMKADIDSTFGPQTWSQFKVQSQSHLIQPQIGWQIDLAPGLKNSLKGEYLGSASNLGYEFGDTSNSNGYFNGQFFADTGISRVEHLVVRDRVNGDWQRGPLHVASSLNFFYDHIEEKVFSAANGFGVSGFGAMPMNAPLVVGPLKVKKGDLLFLTPAVDLGIGRAVDLHVGMQADFSSSRDSLAKRVFPFASAGLDVLHLGRVEGGASLKLFGSYAERALVYLDDYSLADLSRGGGSATLDDLYKSRALPLVAPFGSVFSFMVPVTVPRPYWTWETGSSFTTANGRLEAQYSFERRIFSTPGQNGFIGPTPDQSAITVPSWKSTLHHADVRWKPVDTKAVRWLTALNVTLLRSTNAPVAPSNKPIIFSTYYVYSFGPPVGDIEPAHWSWTGGWVNRWQMGELTAGLDLLYHFGEVQPVNTSYGTVYNGPKLNSVVVPNIYIGDRWKIGAHTLELFLESRGLIRSKNSDLQDGRRYYTIGGKYAL